MRRRRGHLWWACSLAAITSACSSGDAQLTPAPLSNDVPVATRRDAGADGAAGRARGDAALLDAPLEAASDQVTAEAGEKEDASPEGADDDAAAVVGDALALDEVTPPDECQTGTAAAIVAPDPSMHGVCTSAGFGEASDLPSASTVSDDRFSSVTPDELTLVWLADYAGAPTLYYSDRDDAAQPFGEVRVLSSAYYAPERVALSPDGLRLVVTRADHRAFGEFTRVARRDFFGPTPSEASFAAIDLTLGLTLETAEKLGEPIVSADDTALYYARYGTSARDTLYAARRSPGGPWPLGQPLRGGALAAKCGARRRATGISSDELTLFYWDELSSSTRAAFRSSIDGVFERAVDLGSFPDAQPNLACTRLYCTATFAAGDDTAVAAAH